MKKEYISPELVSVEIIGSINLLSNSVDQRPDDQPLDSRDNYDDNTPTRPGFGNVWDQSW